MFKVAVVAVAITQSPVKAITVLGVSIVAVKVTVPVPVSVHGLFFMVQGDGLKEPLLVTLDVPPVASVMVNVTAAHAPAGPSSNPNISNKGNSNSRSRWPLASPFANRACQTEY
jgi:hypothetical protein